MRKLPNKKSKEKIIVGLTGGFGTGKSTAAGFFKKLGFYVIDADKIAGKLLDGDKLIRKKLKSSFAGSIFEKTGKINRKKLAGLVFSDGRLMKKLIRITHPHIKKAIKSKIAFVKNKKFILVEAPLLFESGFQKEFDYTITVSANLFNQLNRLKKKFKLSESQLKTRINSQMSLKKKERLSDFIIDNNAGFTNLRSHVKKIRDIILYYS